MVRDYLSPFKRFPKLHTPSAKGRVGFGPAVLALKPYPSLVVGEGIVGYTLRTRGAAVHPRWVVTTTFSRVDRQGQIASQLDQVERRVSTIRRGRAAGVSFPIGEEPGFYRVTTVFHHAVSKRKLGGFGFYFRVVPRAKEAQLRLDSSSYRPGGTVFGQVENLGTMMVTFGAGYAIERFDGATWTVAPESPRVFILPLYYALPGFASKECSPFRIPDTMAPGAYRMSKRIDFVDLPFPGRTSPPERPTPGILTAEFGIAP